MKAFGGFLLGAGTATVIGTIALVYARTQGSDPLGKVARHIIGGSLPDDDDVWANGRYLSEGTKKEPTDLGSVDNVIVKE
jgi:hypothetical protein